MYLLSLTQHIVVEGALHMLYISSSSIRIIMLPWQTGAKSEAEEM
jgi:hypothetical protein